MYDLSIKDIFRILLKSCIYTSLLVLLFVITYYLLHINIHFAYAISDKLNIPRDLAYTPMSAGFANNIIILSTFFECCFITWFVNRISKIKLIKNIKLFIQYF